METLPRPFGQYTLTAALGEDALGRVYRAVRSSPDRAFVRLRVLESPELSGEALLDAIEENGEVHEFLKNAAIARGVEMDAVEGVPFIAWNEPNGRTLDALVAKCRAAGRKIPVEHALLIVEKIATALDHAFNTTIDGDRTLHGLVWPGFVAISDDGEIRLGGFGLATGVLPALGKPGLARAIAPYVAPEARERGVTAKNSDVYSVGVILLELLTGQPPPPDPLATVKGVAGAPPPPVLPEILSVLRMTLAPAEPRYKSSGDLRRELGKLLFSGPYSPSTFNLAYFLNELFRDEIAAETRARAAEDAPDAGAGAAPPRTAPAARSAAPAASAADAAPGHGVTVPSLTAGEGPSRRGPLFSVVGILAAAAIAGGVYLARRAPAASPASRAPAPAAVARPTPTLLPELAATPVGSTAAMSEAQFRDEVARRLAAEVQKLEDKARASRPTAPPLAPTSAPAAAPEPTAPEPTAPPVAVAAPPEPTAPPTPSRPATREGALVALDAVDTPPRISRIVKPAYPPIALNARIGGTVVLRVLVSEKGAPAEIEVLKEGRAGLTQAAVGAVRQWTFTPATRDGVAVRTWMEIPIPFEP